MEHLALRTPGAMLVQVRWPVNIVRLHVRVRQRRRPVSSKPVHRVIRKQCTRLAMCQTSVLLCKKEKYGLNPRVLTIYVELRDIHAIRTRFTRAVLARRVVNLPVDFKAVFTGVLSHLFASTALSLSSAWCMYFLRIKNIFARTAAIFSSCPPPLPPKFSLC